jgi:hypothetical protein
MISANNKYELVQTETYFLWSVVQNHAFHQVDSASKKNKVKLLRPKLTPKVILDNDCDRSEDDNNETVDEEEDYEPDKSDQSLLQHEEAPSQKGYAGALSTATATETPHSPRPPDVYKEEEEE